jgi:hypothetical protein
MIDMYFKRPIVYDYTFSCIICALCYKLVLKKSIVLPDVSFTISTATDICTIALTMAGFILTLLTVLITFKSGSKVTKSSFTENDTVFDAFFATDYYFITTRHLKNGIKSLTFIALLGYSLKLFLHKEHHQLIFYFNILGLLIIAFTIGRSLLILSKVINLQKEEEED